MLQEIFENLGEWDWFGYEEKIKNGYRKYKFIQGKLAIYVATSSTPFTYFYSLADLLSNPSWCKARWGKRKSIQERLFAEAWVVFSTKAFQTLQREGEKACIEYIKKTML